MVLDAAPARGVLAGEGHVAREEVCELGVDVVPFAVLETKGRGSGLVEGEGGRSGLVQGAQAGGYEGLVAGSGGC